MHADDARLLGSFRTGAIVSWVLMLLVGGATVAARLAGHHALGAKLLVLVCLPGAAFVLCVGVLGLGMLIAMIGRAGGRDE